MYKVTVRQNLKYNETIEGTFEEYWCAMRFIGSILEHFNNSEVTIVKVEEEEEDNKEE